VLNLLLFSILECASTFLSYCFSHFRNFDLNFAPSTSRMPSLPWRIPPVFCSSNIPWELGHLSEVFPRIQTLCIQSGFLQPLSLMCQCLDVSRLFVETLCVVEQRRRGSGAELLMQREVVFRRSGTCCLHLN
jgi:hypothetical protein